MGHFRAKPEPFFFFCNPPPPKKRLGNILGGLEVLIRETMAVFLLCWRKRLSSNPEPSQVRKKMEMSLCERWPCAHPERRVFDVKNEKRLNVPLAILIWSKPWRWCLWSSPSISPPHVLVFLYAFCSAARSFAGNLKPPSVFKRKGTYPLPTTLEENTRKPPPSRSLGRKRLLGFCRLLLPHRPFKSPLKVLIENSRKA